MIKGTHCCHLRNPYCWKNSIWCFVVKQSVTQRLIAQRSRFTRQSPVVALQPFLPNFLKFWGPSFPFKAALFSFDPWRFGLALAMLVSNDYFAAHFQRMHVSRFCNWPRNPRLIGFPLSLSWISWTIDVLSVPLLSFSGFFLLNQGL